MKWPDTGEAYTKLNEGCVAYVYDDAHEGVVPPRLAAGALVAGTLTAGYGHTGHDVVIGLDVTPALIASWFMRDYASASHGAALDLGSLAWPRFDVVRRAALVDMCFQMGEGRLDRFVHMIADLRAYQWPKAAVDLLASPYAVGAPKRAARNAFMVRTGQWPDVEFW